MALIHSTNSTTTRLANTALVMALAPRMRESVYSKICGTTKSKSLAEPFTFEGTPPVLKQWFGTVDSNDTVSYKVTVPNVTHKNLETFKRHQVQYDQTNTFLKRVPWHGVRVADTPDLLLAKRLLKGSTSASQTLVGDDGQSYQTTPDNLPIFHVAHTYPHTTTQGNIVQGFLPTTLTGGSGMYDQDQAVTVNQIIKSVAKLVAAIKAVKDDQGMPLLRGFNPEKDLTILCNPDLYPFMRLALETPGASIGGSNGTGGSSGSTPSFGPLICKDVIPWELLSGVPDIQNSAGGTISPVYPTEFYAAVRNDYVQPAYFQQFEPVRDGDTIPSGYNPAAEARKAYNAAVAAGLSPRIAADAASLYANMEVSHNFDAIGQGNAQFQAAVQEQFFITSRYVGNVFTPFWPSLWKIDPTGVSG